MNEDRIVLHTLQERIGDEWELLCPRMILPIASGAGIALGHAFGYDLSPLLAAPGILYHSIRDGQDLAETSRGDKVKAFDQGLALGAAYGLAKTTAGYGIVCALTELL